jgi:hypothetical protein
MTTCPRCNGFGCYACDPQIQTALTTSLPTIDPDDDGWQPRDKRVMANLIDPEWPWMWEHPTHPIPFARYLPGRLKCKRCGKRFWGTHWTTYRVTRYREHWLRDHCGLGKS